MMKRLLSLALSCMIAFITVILFPVQAFASGFDPIYYAERYPDVAAAVGTSQQALINHYLTFGIGEGRYQNAAEEEAVTAGR